MAGILCKSHVAQQQDAAVESGQDAAVESVRTLLLNHYTTTEGMPELLIVAAEGNDTTKVRTLCWPYITALQLPQSKTIAKLIRNKKLKRC
jgi:hypothetical protein